MQALYAYEQSHQLKTGSEKASEEKHFLSEEEMKSISEGRKLLNEKIKRSGSLFYLLLSYICEISLYVKTDARKRASKYLATEEDKNVNTRLANNKCLEKLWQNTEFQERRKENKTAEHINEDWVKKLYKQLESTDAYRDYIANENPTLEQDKKILLFIWKDIILKNETFLSDLSDEWVNWEDDNGLMNILIGNLFGKASHYFGKNDHLNFRHFISEDKKEYAESLLSTVIEKQDYLFEIIKPKLKNWDADRIAQIDMVLLKMGLVEFLYFPTIPVKVTINEYIDIAKDYSTEQSGQFINGVLDNLRKDLLNENKLRKIERTK